MDNRTQPQPQPLHAMEELRDRLPELHPYMALVLTLEPMVDRGDISSEEYLKWAAMLVSAQGKWLFSDN